jgi:uncharacterized protein YkwD
MRYTLLTAASIVALSGCVVVPIPLGPATPDMSSITITPATTGFGKMLVDFRAQNGLGPVEENAVLTATANAYARTLVEAGSHEHRGPDGSMPWDRAKAQGYCSGYVAENIAWGQRSEAEVFNAWLSSPGHRANMLLDGIARFGLGRYQNEWVLVLGGPC